MRILKNKTEINEYLNYCKTHINETLAVYLKNNKAIIFNICDFIKYKNELFLYIGYIQEEKEIPTDINCIYIIGHAVRARKCKINNIEKWKNELLLHKEKYLKPNHNIDKYISEKLEEYKYLKNLNRSIIVSKDLEGRSSKSIKRKMLRYKYIDKLGGACEKCGNNDKNNLCIVRIDKTQNLNMSNLIRRGSVKDIERQLMNCRLLCHNCLNEIQRKKK